MRMQPAGVHFPLAGHYMMWLDNNCLCSVLQRLYNTSDISFGIKEETVLMDSRRRS